MGLLEKALEIKRLNEEFEENQNQNGKISL